VHKAQSFPKQFCRHLHLCTLFFNGGVAHRQRRRHPPPGRPTRFPHSRGPQPEHQTIDFFGYPANGEMWLPRKKFLHTPELGSIRMPNPFFFGDWCSRG
jgi:hypothetical protein